MEQRAMICGGLVVLIAASTLLGGCARAPERPGAEIEIPAEPTQEPAAGPEIKKADFVVIFAGQDGKYFIYPDYESDKTVWEMKKGVLIQFINGTDMPVKVTASPSTYFGTEISTFSIEKDHSEFRQVVDLPADKVELKIILTIQGDTGPPLVVTGGPRMVVTGSAEQ